MPHESHDTDQTTPVTSTPDHEQLVDAGGSVDADGHAAHEERETAAVASEQQVRVRRTPRYGRFMILGGVIFAIAAFIATYSLPQGQGYDRNTVFGFVLLTAVAVGVGLGALAAIIASAATKHTERTVVADRIDVKVEPAADDEERALDLGELPSEVEQGADAGEQAGDVADGASERGSGEASGDTDTTR
ncbi:hypothetical protein [Humibacter ginsenosidimutans]|uniref:Uncharacterized protein n=1 Tax=Humibacter ginsenosidimutans TaxID=2599293 RepID=A0A5B8M6Z8_9MICO|nr:hypothetical protein [Humibacter ginsenosidimutans]QDZ15230.1 hypothetical protein FPZ11_11085 [Humibacter ginsenosidimutans]